MPSPLELPACETCGKAVWPHELHLGKYYQLQCVVCYLKDVPQEDVDGAFHDAACQLE